MRFILLILPIALAYNYAQAQSVGCGKQASQHKPILMIKFNRVIGGMEARPHSWPWLATLAIDFGHKMSMCGSNIIRVSDKREETDILVTAAHCVTKPDTMSEVPQGLLPSQLQVIAGNHRQDREEEGEVIHPVSQVRFHPGFRFTEEEGAGNDVAIIKLAKPLKFTSTIRPVCLPSRGESLPVGRLCVAAGWGRNDTKPGSLPVSLQQLVVPVHPGKKCHEGWGSSYNEEQMICAGSLKGAGGVCQGDSGGMLACQHEDGWTLYGVPSFVAGLHCVEQGMPPIFSRLSTYMDWIMKNAREMTTLA